MIITTKKQSATESPKLASKAWDKIKTERMTKFDPTRARELDKSLIGLSDAEKKQLLNSHLPESIHTEARQELLKTFSKMSQPFSSDLYKLIINHLPKGMNLESALLVEKNPKLFNKIFDSNGTSGIRLDSSAFQLKAIKYFFQKNADLKVLKKGNAWRSTQDMKHAIDNMSTKAQDRLRNSPTQETGETLESDVERMKNELERKFGDRVQNLKIGKPGEEKSWSEFGPEDIRLIYDNFHKAGVI